MAQISLPTDPRFIDLTGRTHYKLTVLSYAGKNTRGRHQWLCRCECGVEKIIVGMHLHKRKTVSCGCHRLAMARTRHTTHGMTNTALYRRYRSMIARCENPSVKSYADYGGRGIRVCTRWRQSFEAFAEDMGAMPSSAYTIERDDTDGNYEPGNCRWATRLEQNRNRRFHRFIEFNGESKPLSQWEEELGFPKETLRQRITKLGWTIERALTTPCRKVKKRIGGVP